MCAHRACVEKQGVTSPSDSGINKRLGTTVQLANTYDVIVYTVYNSNLVMLLTTINTVDGLYC